MLTLQYNTALNINLLKDGKVKLFQGEMLLA